MFRSVDRGGVAGPVTVESARIVQARWGLRSFPSQSPTQDASGVGVGVGVGGTGVPQSSAVTAGGDELSGVAEAVPSATV